MKTLPWIAMVLPIALAAGCGSEQTLPRRDLREVPADAPASMSSAVYLAKRDGAFSVVRIDANAGTIAALAPSLPPDVEPSSLFISPAQDRFVVSGSRSSRKVILAGTAAAWRVLLEEADDDDSRTYLGEVSPSLDLVVVQRTTSVGAPRRTEVFTFDGLRGASFGPEREVLRVGDGFLVVADHEVDGTEADGVPIIVHDEHTRAAVISPEGKDLGRVEEDASRFVTVFAIDGGFVLWEADTCKAFRADTPSRPTATYRCDSIIPPLGMAGESVFRLGADGPAPLATVSNPPASASLVHHAGGGNVSAFIALRETDKAPVITFVAGDGARVSRDPGDSGGRDWGTDWTRAAGDRERACVLTSFSDCENKPGVCTGNFVDLVCSDGRAVASHRLRRELSLDARPTGPYDFTLTPDGNFLVYIDGDTTHRIDTRTMEDVELVSPWRLHTREGTIPDAFGRTM